MTDVVSFSPWTIARPRLAWEPGDTPRNLDFDDLYAARADALAEARHVVIDGLGTPDRDGEVLWTRNRPLVIGETGFGLGLNLLCAWDHWRRAAPTGARLHWLSVEGFPMPRDEAARALSRFPMLANLAARLLAVWPPAVPGLHVLPLDERVTLTLGLGRADEVLPALVMSGQTGVDAWVLDGFAPARNPDLWSPDTLAQVARLSRPGTRLSTYTAAGAVRRALTDRGFLVDRVAGFGGKREALRGVFQGSAKPLAPSQLSPSWLSLGQPVPPPPRTQSRAQSRAQSRVAIIGAGMAGCALAAALRRRGTLTITVVDRRGHPAQSVPPRLLALMEPRLEQEASTTDRLHAAALTTAVPLYDSLARGGADPWRGPRGVLSPDRGRRNAAWRHTVINRQAWPDDWLRLVDADQAAALTGVPTPGDALWHPQGGCLAPAALMTALLGDTPLLPATVTALEPTDDGAWRLRGEDGTVLLTADAVVLATASETPALWPSAALPLRPTRGQASLLHADGAESVPRVAVSSGAYVTPPVQDSDGRWWRLMGATQTPWRSRERHGDPYAPRAGDEARIRAGLAADWPALADALADTPTEMELAGLRATTPDHLPLAGPLFRAETLAVSHGDLFRKGEAPWRPIPPLPCVDGLWCLTGLGSRGLLTAPLMADVVAAGLTGTPAPLPPDLLAAVHPARFAVRAMVRGKRLS